MAKAYICMTEQVNSDRFSLQCYQEKTDKPGLDYFNKEV